MVPTTQGITNGKAPTASYQVLKQKLKDVQFVHEGNLVEVVFIRKTARQAFFDMGTAGTGVVYAAEMANARDILKKLKPGDRIYAKVIALDNEDGLIELSLSQADEQRTWQQIKDLQESGEIIKVKISGANSGGLMTKVFNIKGFLPISQLSNEHYPKVEEGERHKILEALKKFIGEELSVKIIDVNPRNNKLILSERETIAQNIKELLAKYSVGQEVEVLVLGIADFGVFVRFIDNPQIEGVIHISELDHRLITNPKDVVKVNDVFTAKISDIKDGKVFLSRKACLPNPWEKVLERYEAGKEVRGEVYKFNPFGAIVNLDQEIQGIIRVSDFGGVEEMKKELALGSSYAFIIESIKPEEKRLLLKLKK